MSRIKVKMENNRFRLNFLIPLLCWTVLFQFLIEVFETELNGGIWVSWKLETEKTKEQICNQDCLKLDGKYIKGISAFWRFFGGGESHAGHQNCASCSIKQPGLRTEDWGLTTAAAWGSHSPSCRRFSPATPSSSPRWNTWDWTPLHLDPNSSDPCSGWNFNN